MDDQDPVFEIVDQAPIDFDHLTNSEPVALVETDDRPTGEPDMNKTADHTDEDDDLVEREN